MHRPTVGLIAVFLLGTCAWLWIWPPEWDGTEMLMGATLRMGLVMAAIWLAHPQLVHVPAWIFQAVTAAALVIAVRPKLALFALPLLLAYVLLRPRKRS